MKLDERRLRATLGRPELSRLLQRLRTRLERGTPLSGTLSFTDASEAERDALDRLLGREPSNRSSLTVPLERLEAKLRIAEICDNLRIAVEALTGPVVVRREQLEAEERAWDDLFAEAGKHADAVEDVQRWLQELRASGLLRRYGLEDARNFLLQALKVLAVLPARDVPIAELAASALGDAHALDPDTSVGSLVLRAAAALGRCGRVEDARSRREAWASLGVICDELSAPVLVLNLPAAGESVAAQALRAYASAGEPTYLSIRQLLKNDPLFHPEDRGSVIYVCENPSVMAAAARRLGSRSHCLVCIEGQPRTATRLLLDQLRAAGFALLYHGDFDWPGLQIANTIMERHGARPWRMSAADYRAVARGPLPLAGLAVAATWDPELAPTMEEIGWAVHEEQVLDELLADLDRASLGMTFTGNL